MYILAHIVVDDRTRFMFDNKAGHFKMLNMDTYVENKPYRLQKSK